MPVNPEQVSLRPMRDQDLELVLAWRNDPEVMRYLPSAVRPLLWSHHVDWWRETPNGPANRMDGMVMFDDRATRPRAVGTTHYSKDTGEMGILVGEKTLWGQGVATVALEKMLRHVIDVAERREEEFLGPIWALVHPKNIASRRLFESLNFVAAGEGRNGQIKYLWQGWKA